VPGGPLDIEAAPRERGDGRANEGAARDARGAVAGTSPSPAHAAGVGATARHRGRAGWLVPLALIVLVGAIAALVLLGSGGGGGGGGQGTSRTTPTDQDGAGSGHGRSGASSAAGDAADTVKSFYERAAADDYAGAWALAGPGFRAQLGGYGAFRRTMSTLESIEFRRTATVSQAGDTAQVAVDTVARHTDRVDRCRGTLDLARGGAGGWLIDRARIACTAGGGGARAATASPAGAAATSSEDATGSRSGSTASAAGGSATAAREGGRKAGKAKAETKGGSASTSAEPNE